MARLRSAAHFGTTRSGQRYIARCAQSYLPSHKASHVDLTSFCQSLCCGTSLHNGAKLMTTPSSRFGLHSGATRFTSSRKTRNSSTNASCVASVLRSAAVACSRNSCSIASSLRSSCLSFGPM